MYKNISRHKIRFILFLSILLVLPLVIFQNFTTISESVNGLKLANLYSRFSNEAPEQDIGNTTPDGRIIVQRYRNNLIGGFSLFAFPQYQSIDKTRDIFKDALKNEFRVTYPYLDSFVFDPSLDQSITSKLTPADNGTWKYKHGDLDYDISFRFQHNADLDGQGKGYIHHDERYGHAAFPVATSAECIPDSEPNTNTVEQEIINIEPDFTGQYLCYKMLAFFNFHIKAVLVKKPDIPLPNIQIFERMFQAPVSFVLKVKDEYGKTLENPEIVAGQFDGPWKQLLIKGTHGIRGSSSSATSDSRLLGWQEVGISDSSIVFNSPWNRKKFSVNLVTFNPTPWKNDTWIVPELLNNVHEQRGDKKSFADQLICLKLDQTCLPEERFSLKNVYRVFKNPFVDPFGKPITPFLRCPYIWFSPDGDNMACSTLTSQRRVLTFAGQSTEHFIKVVDGPANGAHQGTDTFEFKNSLQLGSSRTGLWRTLPGGHPSNFFESLKGPNFQILTRAGHFNKNSVENLSKVFFTTITEKYGFGNYIYSEIPVQDFDNENYLFYFGMAPAMQANSEDEIKEQISNRREKLAEFSMVTDRVADTSGNMNTGYLRDNTLFETDYFKRTQNEAKKYYSQEGLFGQAIYFHGKEAAINLKNEIGVKWRIKPPLSESSQSSNLTKARNNFSVEFAFKPLSPAALENATFSVFKWNNIIDIEIQQTKLIIKLQNGDKLHTVNSEKKVFDVNNTGWIHVGLSVSKNIAHKGSGALVLYLNGLGVFSTQLDLPKYFVPKAMGDGVIASLGPNGSCSLCPDDNLYALDEFALSRAFLTKTDYKISSKKLRIGTSNNYPLNSYPLPPGFKENDLEIDPQLSMLMGGPGDYQKIAKLGARLFADTILSTNSEGINQNISCQTCHIPEKNFTDGTIVSTGVNQLTLNSPTITNRAFARRHFFDQRVDSLTVQSIMPITNVHEMNGDMGQVVKKLSQDESYVKQFTEVFSSNKINAHKLRLAIAAFVGTVRSGVNLSAFKDDANFQEGQKVFNGNGRCIACHSGPNFTDEMMHRTRPDRPRIKTPSLVNISLSAPYFHDGEQADLRSVVEFYTNPKIRNNIDNEVKPISLTQSEKDALVYFLENLNGRIDYEGKQ